MKRYLFFAIVFIVTLGCDKSEDEVQKYAVNVKFWVGDRDYYPGYIAVVPRNKFPEIHDKDVIKRIINENKTYYVYGDQFTDYLPEGEYTVLIQLSSFSESQKDKYTFRHISNIGQGSRENLMQFDWNNKDFYQPWKNKN